MTQTEQAMARYIGGEIRRRREAIVPKLSQERLGGRIGMSRQTIYDAERGARNPEWQTLPKIADALGCHITDLLPKDAAALDSAGGTRAVTSGELLGAAA